MGTVRGWAEGTEPKELSSLGASVLVAAAATAADGAGDSVATPVWLSPVFWAMRACARAAAFLFTRIERVYTAPGSARPVQYFGVVGTGGAPPRRTTARSGCTSESANPRTGRPTQKQRSITASSTSHCITIPSSDDENACSTLVGECATAVTWSVWPVRRRSCAPVAHEKILMTQPEQHSRYFESLLNVMFCCNMLASDLCATPG